MKKKRAKTGDLEKLIREFPHLFPPIESDLVQRILKPKRKKDENHKVKD